MSDDYEICLQVHFSPVSLFTPFLSRDDRTQEFACEIIYREYESDLGFSDKTVGEITGWIVPFFYDEHTLDVHDIADIEGLCWHLVNRVVDPKTNDYRDELGIIHGDILCISEVSLLPTFRGRNLGLAAVREVIEQLGRGCGVAVLKPFPLENGQELTEDEVETAQEKLSYHWRKLGFEPVPCDPDYLYFNMEHILKTVSIKTRGEEDGPDANPA